MTNAKLLRFARQNHTDTVTISVFSDEGDEFKVDVEYEYWHDSGVRYHLDGSGTPPDSGYEYLSFTASAGKPPIWVTDDLVEETFINAVESGEIPIN